MRSAITKIERRLADLEVFDPDKITSPRDPVVGVLEVSIKETLRDVFGDQTPAYHLYHRAAHLDRAPRNYAHPTPLPEIISAFKEAKRDATALLQQAIRSFKEKLADLGSESSDDDPVAKILRAYEGLDLHPEIARAASELFHNGHYANAIEDAVKALNQLVRLRSGQEADGITLMERVFSPNKPILRFNDMRDQSDHDEQKGFMMMFSGAVAGLRNPRAHRLIQDDPERALEFIAFVSLLAKLLDGAKKMSG
jgi:uncharacterized protein (TIGR02391 family)